MPKYDFRPNAKRTFKDVVTVETAYGKPNESPGPIKGIING